MGNEEAFLEADGEYYRIVVYGVAKNDQTADIMYLFRRSVEITKKNSYVGFWAQIGRLMIWQVFTSREMLIQDELEL
ncbi:MAG: hypothetical protein JO307_26630 [Bryobacterales bacterium]|nr:hypothetical protein [Bryobacterales bacterium]MBV9396532.1 hypothetical protein [Bryobacterales bacterium]